MGKAKSFIIVGSFFLALFIIILLVTLFSGGNTVECYFSATSYYIEIDETRALVPEVVVGRKISNVKFDFSLSEENIVEVQMGSFAKKSGNVSCWTFVEMKNNEEIIKKTAIPYDSRDSIHIEDDYWYINNIKTRIKAERSDYTQSEITQIAQTTEDSTMCWVLNGVATNIGCREEYEPVRGENGNWFIRGDDTGYTYEGMVVSITGLAIGKVVLTMTGELANKPIEISTTLDIILPDPASIVFDKEYPDNTLHIAKGESFEIGHTLKASEGKQYTPVQTVNYSIDKTNLLTVTDGVFTAKEKGTVKLRIYAPASSFLKNPSSSVTVTITIIILDVPDELVEEIVAIKNAIASIKTVNYDEKSRNAIEKVTTLLADLDEEYYSEIPNYKVYQDAVKKYNDLKDAAEEA